VVLVPDSLSRELWSSRIADMQLLQEELTRIQKDGGWLSGPESLMDVLAIEWLEVHHSRVIAWLLDPSGQHGLGDLFLRSFVNASTGRDPGEVGQVSVNCEVTTADDRRADIVVWGPTFTIIIENKVSAGEQPHQCDDLYKNFRHEQNPVFVFLTWLGTTPKTATGEAKVAFQSLTYRELAQNLRVALEEKCVPGASARNAAWDYLHTLEVHFG
jgi:hypothetical protein